MGLDEGYIGVTTDPKARWSRHKSKNSDSNDYLKRAIVKYNPSFKIIAVFDSLEDALWQEFTLRPFDRMGWNLTKGGGLPPSMGGWNRGVKTPDEARRKQSEARKGRFSGKDHPRAKIANIYSAKDSSIVAECVVISEWAKTHGFHQAHLSATANGKLKTHKGLYARYI